MTFADRLHAFPIVLEIVPPSRRAGAGIVEGLVRRVQDAFRQNPGLDAVNFPEVVDENRVGRPFYRNLDPRKMAQLVNDGVSVETIVNKIVVHLNGHEALEEYLRTTMDAYGLRNFVLVGGSSGRNAYPGPDVILANAILRDLTRDRPDVSCGNILIPERMGEAPRMLRKTRAGCTFFTTQVLFEPEPITSVLLAYADACAAEELEPATVLLSFAPAADRADIELLKWLGAIVTPDTERRLLVRGDQPKGRASLDNARSAWDAVVRANARASHPVPLGVNIEEISAHNIHLAIEMAEEFVALRAEARG